MWGMLYLLYPMRREGNAGEELIQALMRIAQKSVILSEVRTSQREVLTKSKDPMLACTNTDPERHSHRTEFPEKSLLAKDEIVILSEVRTSQREVLMKSKDPMLACTNTDPERHSHFRQ